MQTDLDNQVEQVAVDFKQSLQSIYGDQLIRLILFGSYARGDSHSESDVDFAVVLKDPATRPAAEIVRLASLTAELSLKHGVIISILPVSEQKLSLSGQGVYEAIRREGIRI